MKPLRPNAAKKNFNKKRKKKNNFNKAEDNQEVKRQRVDYENADFGSFGNKKGKEAKMFDPWKGYANKHKKGGGKQKQKYKGGSGKSVSFKKK